MLRSARELIERYRTGELRPSEAVEQLAARCSARQDAVGAFTATRWEQARAEALEHDEAYRRGVVRGPLAGVPVAVKDLIDTADLVTAYGSPMFAGHRPARDAAVVEAVRRAGAIVVGKTVTHEFAWGITSLSEGTRCRNPLDPERIAGGSSGGAAAAVADGQVPLAIGTDTAGSIRVPAVFCGTVGFKPSFGSISTRGCWPLAPSLDHVGVIARDPADVALVVAALRGSPEGRVRSGAPTVALAPDRAPEAAAVALPPDLGPRGRTAVALAPDLAPPARDAVARAGLAAVDSPVALGEQAYQTLRAVQGFEAVAVHRAADLYPRRRASYGDDVCRRLDGATEVTDDEYRRALGVREALRGQVRDAFAGQAILVSTPVTVDPPRVADLDAEGADARLRDELMPGFALQSLLGLPTCVVPLPTESAFPRALQVTGRRGSDDLVLATAAALSRGEG